MHSVRRFVMLVVAVGPATAAAAAIYTISPGAEASRITFTSKAPMETFQGRTHEVSGTIEIAPGDGADTVRVRAVVPMATLETGITLRDRHMRENHLETDRFPEGRFEGEGVAARAPEGGPGALTLRGTLTLHGVAREVEIPATWSTDASGVRIEASFPVALADHAIPRPGFLAMKLGEVQRVDVSLRAEPRAPAP